MRSKLKALTENATFAALAGVLLGALLGYVGRGYELHDAVTYNNISSYIESLLVQPGYVSVDILERENPFQQIEAIGEQFSKQISQYNSLANSIQLYLVEIGEMESSVSGLNDNQLSSMLSQTAKRIKELEIESENYKSLIEEYKSQILARLSTPKAYIAGEPSNTPLKDYCATINAHRFYSEEFLNTFLPEELSYDGNAVYYAKDAPERLNVVTSGLVYDVTEFDFYDGGRHFSMGMKDYSNGIVNTHRTIISPSMKIACDENYSTISFSLGHIDNADGQSGSLSIYYMDNEGIYKESKTIPLYMDMPVEQYEVPIYHTRNVKITVSNTYGIYALANVYLVK